MDSYSTHREVEKPKPIKQRASVAAQHLRLLREHMQAIYGVGCCPAAITEAIDVLTTMAGDSRLSTNRAPIGPRRHSLAEAEEIPTR